VPQAPESDSSVPSDRFDIAVVGGGLIGAAAALGAARLGRRVVLLEPQQPRPVSGRLGHDLRNIAIAPANQQLLETLGVWSQLAATPYHAMRIWDTRGTGTLAFDAADVGRQELGWMLENSATLLAVWALLGRESNLTVCAGQRVIAVAAAAAGVRLELEREVLHADLVIAADGARSVVREALGVGADVQETGQHALATVVRTERPHAGVAYQCFQADGPLALLPGREPALCSVVWSQSPGNAERHRNVSEAEFCAAVSRAMDGCLGAVLETDERLVFPLRQMLADSLNPQPRVLLIGDAGHVLHPLAGLGANLGFEDVRALLEVLRRLPAGGDPGAAGLWRTFARQRRARARMLIGLMAMVQRLYTGTDPWQQLLRNTGVSWLNRLGPIKRQIMMEAMGLGPVATQGATVARG